MKSSFDTLLLSESLCDLMPSDGLGFVRGVISVKMDFICLQSQYNCSSADVVQEYYNLPIK